MRAFQNFFYFAKKTRMNLLIKMVLSLVWLLPCCLNAQTFSPNLNLSDTTQIHVLKTHRGDVFTGRVIEIMDTNVRFRANGDISLEFRFAEIISVSVQGEAKTTDDASMQNPKKKNDHGLKNDTFPTQIMFYAQSAFALEKGKKLFTNVDLLWNSLDFAVTDRFSAGVGVFLPIRAIVRGKYAYEITEKVRLGVGSNIFTIYDFYDLNMVGHVYGVVTFGTPELFVNLTGGYFLPVGFIEDRVIGTSAGVGGETERFIYKAEVFVYREPNGEGQLITSLFPELGFVVKSGNKRYEFGVFGVPFFDFPIFPYLAFKSHF